MENNENMHTYDNGFHPREVKLKPNYKFYNRNVFFVFFSTIVIYITAFFLFFIGKICWGLKVTGKKNLKNVKGAITISNHTLQQDGFINVASLLPRKTYITMLQSNLGFPVVSNFMRIAAAVPIPEDRHLFVRFLKETKDIIKKGKYVHIYPEAALKPYCDHIRPFMPGAFHIAYQANAPIIPIVFTFHKPKGIYKLYKKKPVIRQNILAPYYPDFSLPRKEGIKKMTDDLYQIMSDYFTANSDYYKKN